jgi:hypothetical protein
MLADAGFNLWRNLWRGVWRDRMLTCGFNHRLIDSNLFKQVYHTTGFIRFDAHRRSGVL